ncbi:PAS domain-containing sensor histidine kinase [Mucilaginibacter terrae]|uniref:histidine kinase n=1 Tax=Mucilaginibacter terrae TaxID=1955052 RepID=A0ABU3GZW7_9SPHI|nr:HAMP domain-containing sensor histidine kinase [Mucilaginibacter terrae]MDT3405318.1 nitrogen fixation/metabolism regulation signal transduction histidine kinase [Mucilaginibacter terrae]
MTPYLLDQQISAPLLALTARNSESYNDSFNNHIFNEIFTHSNIGVWTLKEKSLRLKVSYGFQLLLGLAEQQDYTFTEIFQFVAHSQRYRVVKELKRACKCGNNFAIEFKCKANKPGVEGKWFKLTGKSSHHPKSSGVSYLGSLTDITETKNLETWNSDRLALLGHELKGPLSAIKLYLQRAHKISTENNIKDAALFLSKADDQVSSMAYLMEDLLTCSTIENKQMNLDVEYFDLSSIVEPVIEEMKLKHTDYHFINCVPAAINLRADKRKINQVIKNYLTNAVKYSLPGSEITIGARNNDGNLIVFVKDTGTGMDHEHLEKVFDRYYRVNGTMAEGHGLGLYLVKEIISRHGGNVWVQSVPDQGSEFYFSIPKSTNTFKQNHGLV